MNIFKSKWAKKIMGFATLHVIVGLHTTIGEETDKPNLKPRPKDGYQLEQPAIDEIERAARRSRTSVPAWEPTFVECDGISNFRPAGEYSSDARQRSYTGRDDDRKRLVNVVIHRYDTSREAQKSMLTSLSKPSRRVVISDIEIDDPDKQIGDRSFKLTTGKLGDRLIFDMIGENSSEVEVITEQVYFVRNNYFVKVSGVRVRVESLARDMDRQILELYELHALENEP